MTAYHGPIVHILKPDLVEIVEEPEPYRMTRADIEEAIQNVKHNRSKYATDVAYLKRLNFFEHILAQLPATVQSSS